MTRAEYLEFIEESMLFPSLNQVWSHDASMVLRDTEEVCRALQRAHEEYCAHVECILFPERGAEVARRMETRQIQWDAEDRIAREAARAQMHAALSQREPLVKV